MNNVHLDGEIKAFYGDIKATQDVLSFQRENLARELKNGFGDEIKKHLNNPPKPNYFKGLKMKIKRWINNKKSGI